MGRFFSDLLSSLDSCEREVEKILHFIGKVRIKSPRRKECSNDCRRDREEELECECECECRCERERD